MDTVVYLALLVLAAVFLVSLIVLVLMCRRRQLQKKNLLVSPHLRFSKLRNENLDTLVQLTPLLADALDKNNWVYDVGGILQHCVVILKLSHSLSEKLAIIPLSHTSPQLQDFVCEATHKVMPRFDDLLAAIASPKVDVRILEARASALATVCWSLLMPFCLVFPKNKEVLTEPVTNMHMHLEALRAAAELAERENIGKLELDWSRVEVEDKETTETTPVMNIETTSLTEKPAGSEARSEIVSNGHPVDPSG